VRDQGVIHSIEGAMVRIARSLGRRDLGRQIERNLGSRLDLSFLQVISAIDELTGPKTAPNIKDVARHLDVHHSRASRLVKDTIRAGFILRLASQEDARKSPLALSEKGGEIARAIHAARAKYYTARLRGWSKSDRRNLARLLERFAESVAAHGKDDRGGGADADTAASAQSRKARARKRRRKKV